MLLVIQKEIRSKGMNGPLMCTKKRREGRRRRSDNRRRVGRGEP